MKAIASDGTEINTGDAVLIRDDICENWRYAHFSHIEKYKDFSYICSYSCCRYCIPYKGNEHLVGTSTNILKLCPKFKFGAKVRIIDTNNNTIEGILTQFDTEAKNYPYGITINKQNGTIIGTTIWVKDVEYI